MMVAPAGALGGSRRQCPCRFRWLVVIPIDAAAPAPLHRQPVPDDPGSTAEPAPLPCLFILV